MGIIDRFKSFFQETKIDMQNLVRASVINPNTFRTDKNQTLLPDETKYYGFQRLKLDDLHNLPASKAINYLIKSNDSLKFAVDTYTDYTVPDFTIEADDENDYQIIETWIDGFPNGRAGFLNYLRQLAYGRYVEGGICSEGVTDAEGMPIKAVYVSPWSLVAEKRETPELGEYYVYGQRQQGSNREIKVLIDEAHPGLTKTIYLPAHRNGDDPFGSSQVAPAIFSVSSLQQLLSDLVNFMQGKVFPKHVYSIDVQALAAAGFTASQIAEAQALATNLLKNTLDGADITEDVILSVPIVATLVGATERARLDGIEMIVDIFERMQQRGLKVPRVLYGSRRSGGAGLNDNESKVEWFSFFKRIFSGMADIEAVIRFHVDDLLMMHGSTGTGGIMLDRSDPMLQEYEAQLFKMQMEGWTELTTLRLTNENGAEVPLFTAEEIRRKIIETQPAFNDMDLDLPQELQEMEKQLPPPMPMNGDKGDVIDENEM